MSSPILDLLDYLQADADQPTGALSWTKKTHAQQPDGYYIPGGYQRWYRIRNFQVPVTSLVAWYLSTLALTS